MRLPRVWRRVLEPLLAYEGAENVVPACEGTTNVVPVDLDSRGGSTWPAFLEGLVRTLSFAPGKEERPVGGWWRMQHSPPATESKRLKPDAGISAPVSRLALFTSSIWASVYNVHAVRLNFPLLVSVYNVTVISDCPRPRMSVYNVRVIRSGSPASRAFTT